MKDDVFNGRGGKRSSVSDPQICDCDHDSNSNLFDDVTSVRALSRQLFTAVEDERKKIARDLHDECGQLVAVIGMGLTTLKDKLPDDQAECKAMCDHYMGIIETLSEKIRTMSSELHPNLMDYCGLTTAITWYVDSIIKNAPALTYDFQTNMTRKRLGSTVDIVLYRIIQESLTNVIKHARASYVAISLIDDGNVVSLTVQDNGCGFQLSKRTYTPGPGCMGLWGMRERAEILNGVLKVDSRPDSGTTVTATLPIPEECHT